MQTCISCGLVVAREQLLSGGPYYRPESTGHIILLTDGTQTIDGTDTTAMDEANATRAEGIRITVVPMNSSDLNMDVIRSIASDPDHVHIKGDAEALPDVDQLVDSVCAEVGYICRLSLTCEQPLSVGVHGRGFVDTPSLRCRSGGEEVDGTFVDATAIRGDFNDPPDFSDPITGAAVTVEISLDGGSQRLHAMPVRLPKHTSSQLRADLLPGQCAAPEQKNVDNFSGGKTLAEMLLLSLMP